jgi:UDP-N-acetylglucosamine acyltransferase
MASRIHPTALIDPSAQLGVDVDVGAFAFVGAGVVIGDRCRLHHHASVEGVTTRLAPTASSFRLSASAPGPRT